MARAGEAVRGPSARVVLVAMTASLAMVFIDQTGVSVALPTIRSELGLDEKEFVWVVNGYLLAVAASAITLGRLGDQLGHARGAALSMAIFAVGSVLCGAAQSPEWLIGARVFQGLGGGMMTSCLVAVVSQAFPEERRGRALGLYWGTAGLALSVGPLLGGVITDALSWRWVFWVNPLITLGVLPVVIGLVRSQPRPRRRRIEFDLVGSGLLAAAMSVLIIGVQEVAIGLIAVALALFAALIAVEQRRSDPLIDLGVFRDRTRGAAFLVIALSQPVMLWIPLYFSDYLQSILSYEPRRAGLALLPLTVGLFTGSVLGGRVVDRFGPRRPSVAGIGAVAVALLWLASTVDDDAYLPLLPGLAVLGLGLQFAISPMSTAVLNSIGDARRAMASGVLGTCRQTGGTVGLAALTALMISEGSGTMLPHAMEMALLAQVGLAVVSLGVLLALMPRAAPRPAARAHVGHSLRFLHGH